MGGKAFKGSWPLVWPEQHDAEKFYYYYAEM